MLDDVQAVLEVREDNIGIADQSLAILSVFHTGVEQSGRIELPVETIEKTNMP